MLNNFIWLTPEIFLSIITVWLLGYGVIYSKLGGEISQQKKITWLSITALIFTVILEINSLLICNQVVEGMIYISQGLYGVDGIIIGMKIAILLGSMAVLLLSLNYYAKENLIIYEYTQLILLSTLGMMLLISSQDLISLYLSIELISLSLYVLAGINKNGQYSTEASIKYFLLGAVSSGILLFGSALIYWLTGETSFVGVSNFIWYSPMVELNSDLTSLSIAAMFIIIALLFKLAAAPFHMWAPDVYEGSPTIVTAYFAIVPKIATLGILYQLLFGPFASIFSQLQPLLIISALLSVIIGSLGAINQTKIKRLLAYSAIGHMGFMLIGFSSGALNGLLATFIYIIIYMITSLNTFAFVLSFTSANSANFISQLGGLSRLNPLLAVTFALGLFSMAGIPPLAGFFSKYLILLSAIQNNLYFLAFIAIVFSVIASFYYIRLIRWMFFKDSLDYLYKNLSDISMKGLDSSPSLSQSFIPSDSSLNINLIHSLILGSTLFIILTFLLYPNPLFNFLFDSLALSLF
jgi:NADH-quinone oxidoreductase subunit N